MYSNIKVYHKYLVTSIKVGCATRSLYASSGPRDEGVPTNNQRGRGSGPCRLWGGWDKARHIVPTALLVRLQRFMNDLYMYEAVKRPSTRPTVLSMIAGSYWRRRRRLAIIVPDEMKFASPLTLRSLYARCWQHKMYTRCWQHNTKAPPKIRIHDERRDQRASYRLTEYNVQPFFMDRTGRPPCFSDRPIKHNLGRGLSDCFLLSFLEFNGSRGEVENVSANQRPNRGFQIGMNNPKLIGRGRWDFALNQVFWNSVQRFQRSSRKCFN